MKGRLAIRWTVFWVYFLALLFSCSEEAEPIDCAESDLAIEVTRAKYADCGIDNGEISVSTSGGRQPYQYSLDGGQQQSQPDFLNVRPGFHSIAVRDAHGCVRTVNTFVGSKEPFPVNTTTTPSGCNGNNGSIAVFPLGGVPPYKYQLGENNDDYQSSNVWENLRSGTHSIWVEDANKCFFGVYVHVPSGVSFKESIAPIIENNCAMLACHGGGVAPDFRDFPTIRANASKIKSVVNNRSMPPDNPLAGEEIQLITCWVDDGAPNN